MLLRDFVNKKIASADKEASAEGVPLTLNNCKKYKKMRDLKVYGNCFQDGTPTPENPIEVQCVGGLVTDENDINYGKYKVPIVQRGKNLFGGVYGQFWKLNLTKGDTYTVSVDDATTKEITLLLYDSIQTRKQNVYMNVAVNGRRSTTFTVEYDDVQYVMFAWGAAGSASLLIDAQITTAETAGEYEPYVEPIRTNLFLDEPLRKVDDYADYIDGKNKKFHRFLHDYYLDGSQKVTKYSDDLCFVEGGVRCKSLDSGLSNHFRHRSRGTTVPNIAMANATGSRIQIGRYYDIDGVTDADTLKQWLAKNPTTFIQPLETPIVEDLNIELPKLNAKTTIIEVDTSLAPSNISGKYILR